MKMNFAHFWILVCMIFSSVSTLSQGAHAEDVMELSSNLDVEFAFYKIANSKPDFDRISVMISEDDIKGLGPENKARHLEQVKNQLEAQFYSIKPKQDNFFSIEIPAKIEFLNMEEGNRDPRKPGYMSIFFENGTKDPPYLIKPLTDLKANLIVKNIDDFLNFEFNDVERETVFTQFSYGGNAPNMSAMHPVKLRLRLKPLSVDGNGPVIIRDQEVWLMLNEIVEMQILSFNNDNIIWSKRAPWYEKKNMNKIMRLYKG